MFAPLKKQDYQNSLQDALQQLSIPPEQGIRLSLASAWTA